MFCFTKLARFIFAKFENPKVFSPINQSLAEYGWKPHRIVGAQKSISRASTHWYMREKQGGTVSSNSRFQTVLFKQYSANLSRITVPQRGIRKGGSGKTTTFKWLNHDFQLLFGVGSPWRIPTKGWLYYTIVYYSILINTVLNYIMIYYTTLRYTILYYTILYYTILYN